MNENEGEIMRAQKEKLDELFSKECRKISKEDILLAVLRESLPVKITFDGKNCIITDGLKKELLKIDMTSVVCGEVSSFYRDIYAKFYFEAMDGERISCPFPDEQDIPPIEKSDMDRLKKNLKNMGYRIGEIYSSETGEAFFFVQERDYGILKNTIWTKSATNNWVKVFKPWSEDLDLFKEVCGDLIVPMPEVMIIEEEMAEEYARNEIERGNFSDKKNGTEFFTEPHIKQAYLAGLKAGKPKWHMIADGDFPKESGDYITNIGVLTYDKYGNDIRKWSTPICEACDYEDNVRNEVIAWCEMPIFEKG